MAKYKRQRRERKNKKFAQLHGGISRKEWANEKKAKRKIISQHMSELGKKGGKARTEALTPDQRHNQALKAGLANKLRIEKLK